MHDSKPAAAILSRILADLHRGEVKIPAVPRVVGELRDAVGRTDTKVEAVARLVERDASVASRVLQLGRSATFGRAGQPPDLRFIITRVGFRQVATIVESIWVNNCFQVADARYQPYAQRLSRQAVARALCMRSLAEVLRVDGNLAYLGGLFADVGAAFLLWAIVDKTRARAPDPEDALAFIREHHEAIGAAVLKRWGQTEALVGFVRKHHTLGPSAPGAWLAPLFVVAADMAAALTGESDITIGQPWPDLDAIGACAAQLGLSGEACGALFTRLSEEYPTFAAALT